MPSLFLYLCPQTLNISNLRAFLTFQHKHSANSPSCYWAHAPQISEPLHVCNEQCNSYKFLFLSCSDVWHFFSFFFCCCYRIIFLPSPPFSLSAVSLSGLKDTFGDSTGPAVTHLDPLIILNGCRTFLFNYGLLFDAINSALLHFCCIT